MLTYPNIDPVAVNLFGLKIHWYGLMYVAGFSLSYLLAKYRIKKGQCHWTMEQVGDLTFYTMLGVIVGGRLGYFIFYQDPMAYLSDPLQLLMIHKGGMAFHGAALGVTAAIWYFSRQTKRSLLEVGDFVVPLVPLGIALGRVGNFINAELWGRVVTTEFPLAMIFPGSDGQPRHPSQLYQASLEGIALFVLLWWYSSKPRPTGTTAALFLMGYGCARFIVEFFRQPDAHIHFVVGNWGTMGHMLSAPMVLGGALLFLYCQKRSVPDRTFSQGT